MSSPDPLPRTSLPVSLKARLKVKSTQAMLSRHLGYRPAYSEVLIRGMEAIEREIEASK